MAQGDPRRQRQYRYGELTPGEFEGLVFRVAWVEDRRVVRLQAPDGGLDTLLPDERRPGKAAHGWQAKRHTKSIDWDDCAQSLDRSVDLWEPSGLTFVFPKDLNRTEHATFHRRLSTRHAGVKVDYWGKAALDARLQTTEGERIAASFFEEQDARAMAERMLRAGSPLRSGEDFLAAEGAIAQGLARADPDYDWVIHRAAHGLPQPPLTEGTVLRLSFERGDVVINADLVPRHGSPALRPGVTFQLDDSAQGQRARAWLTGLVRSPGRLKLGEGASVRLSDVPAPFGEMLDQPLEGEIVMRAQPAALYGRISAGPLDDRVVVDVDLLPVEAPEDWDAMLRGSFGGLEITLSFRWFIHEGRGQSRLEFRYRPTRAPHRVEAQALRWMCAAHREGVITLEDRTGARPVIETQSEEVAVPPSLALWARVHSDLAELEIAAGRPAPSAPDELTTEDIERVATVAAMLRARRYPGTIREITMTLRPGAPTPWSPRGVAKDVRTQRTLVAIVFGEQFPVAREFIELAAMVVAKRTLRPDGTSDIRLVPLGSEVAEVMVELVPLSEASE